MAQLTTESVAVSTLLSKYQAIRSVTSVSRRTHVGGGSNDPILPGGEPHEVASGPHNVVLRDFHPSSISPRITSRSVRTSVASSTATTTLWAIRFLTKPSRSFLSRPSLDEVVAFRRHVDAAIETILADPGDGELERRIVLGLNHEQQHQELMLTDIKHALFSNPLRPVYCATPLTREQGSESLENTWHDFRGGLVEIGCSPDLTDAMDFCFDNETPRHKVYLENFKISGRGVTCREYLNFMADDGYARPEFWLSEGWDAVRREGWRSPLYWERDATDETGWRVFTLKGSQPLSSLLETAVCHVSYFEADAFAKWSGCRLPTEQEWEIAAIENPVAGNFLETGRLHTGRRRGPASTNSSEIVGSGQRAPTPPIRATTHHLAPSVSTTASLCRAR